MTGVRLQRLFCVVVALAWSGLSWCQTATVAPPAPRFDIQRFVIEGNTLIPAAEADGIVAPFAGRGRDFGDVQRALEALQEAYLARGYSAVRVLIPEQDLVVGQVRIQVIEARIRNVRVENNRFFDEANVRAGLPSLKAGEAPNTRRIGANAQLVNENPAKQVGVRMEATDETGKVDAVVRVADEKPIRHSIFLDNSGTSQTGYYRAGYGFQHANLFNRDHVFTAQVVTSPTQISDVLIVGAGYRIPLYQWNGMVDFIAGYSNVNSGTIQDLFTVSGSGSFYGARYSQFLPRLGAYEHKLALGFDYRDFKQNVAFVGTTGTVVPDVTLKPLSLTYSGRLSEVGRDISMFVSESVNLPGGADGNQAAITAQRPGANAHYSILRFGAAYSQGLPDDLLFRAVLVGQYTTNALVIMEQFGMGGADNVRGFQEREVSSDIGHRGSLELYSPDWGKNIGADWRGRMLVFTDWARGRDNVPERAGPQGLASVGVGLRMTRSKSLSLRVDLAHVTNTAGARANDSYRGHFLVSYSF